MVKQLVPDELWMIIEPLLPPEPPKPNGGRPRVPDRAALAGIIYVLKSGIPWGMLASTLASGSRTRCSGRTVSELRATRRSSAPPASLGRASTSGFRLPYQQAHQPE